MRVLLQILLILTLCIPLNAESTSINKKIAQNKTALEKTKTNKPIKSMLNSKS